MNEFQNNIYTDKVSFIVPIYKVEKYILRCVKSIQIQSYPNIEIILVNDGSPDSSGDIIDKLAKNDKRIKIIHQQNLGVSSARNAGLEIASGEYITFVDGDDYIEDNYTEYFLNLIKNNNVDMAIGLNHFSIYSENQTRTDKSMLWNNIKVIEKIYLGEINVAVWNKMYKKSVLNSYNIRFHTDIWYGEGMLFNIEYLNRINQAIVGNRKIYHQVYNPGSAMRKFNLESNLCGMRSMEIQKNLLSKTTPEIEKAWKYHYRNFSRSIINGLVSTNTIKKNYELYNQCKKTIRKNLLLPWKVNIPFNQKIKLTIFSFMPYIIALYNRRKNMLAAKHQEQILKNNNEVSIF